MKPARSLQGRLTALVLASVLALWAVALAGTWREARHELDELLDSHLAQSAALLLAQRWRADHGDRGDDDEHRRVDTPLLHPYAPRTAFQVWHEGRLALRSANAPATPMAAHAEGFATVRLAGQPWRVFVARGAEDDMQVFVGEQTGSRADILMAVMRSLVLPLVLALPLLAAAIWWAVRRGLLPLRRLSEALAARQPQALDAVVLPDAPAEMAPLLDALNGLFERITRLLEGERRFTADAAHELRTPIAAIRAQAQVALGAADDDTARTRALQSTLLGCDRAAHLVEQLLTLSRVEAAPAQAAAPVDLAALARRVAADVAPAALARSQDLSLEAPAGCTRSGHEALLAVLLRNLLDNALRYSPPGARIRVAVARDELTVEDSGPGVTEGDRARLGERFFRVLGTGVSGSGLGLSIARRIAQAHGAQFVVEASQALGGLCVRVRWAS